MDQPKAKGREADADARLAYEEKIKDVKAKRQAARAKLEELRNSSTAAWDEL